MNRCCQCIMPETGKHIVLNPEGVCNICTNHRDSDSMTPTTDTAHGLVKLQEDIADAKRLNSGAYDCIIAVSGGKDSLLTLWMAVRELKLRPLVVFVDNGFALDEMYQNIMSAVNMLDVDLLIYRPRIYKAIFKQMLLSRLPVYFCRVCHAILDKQIRDVARKFGIGLLLGGYTTGQQYVRKIELYWIYRISDQNTRQVLQKLPEYDELMDLFRNPAIYFTKNYGDIKLLSPFWYIQWNEAQILRTLVENIGFKPPAVSWPDGSTNCMFNFVSQYLSRQFFGYSQHEVEISSMIRDGEIERKRGMEIIESPIRESHLSTALQPLNLDIDEILTNEMRASWV